MGFALSSFLILSGVGIAAGTLATYVMVERSRRRRQKFELALLQERGQQSATEFAALFVNESERRVAERLYPKLQELTATESVPLRPEDLLFTQLAIDDEDLIDEIDAVFSEFGRKRPNTREWDVAFGGGINTVGELVTAVKQLLERTSPR